MATAWENVSEAQRLDALACIKHLCEVLPRVTTDDFHALASARNLRIRPKAIGPLWKRARLNNWVEPTGEYVPTKRPRAHGRPIPVMRSLLYCPPSQ